MMNKDPKMDKVRRGAPSPQTPRPTVPSPTAPSPTASIGKPDSKSSPLRTAFQQARRTFKEARTAAKDLSGDARKTAMQAARVPFEAARDAFKTGTRMQGRPSTPAAAKPATPVAPKYGIGNAGRVRPSGFKSGGCVTAGRGGKYKGTM